MQPALRYCSLIFGSLMAFSCSSMPPRMDADTLLVDSLSRQGPHHIRSYISLPDAPEYAGATIYYPLDTLRAEGQRQQSPLFGRIDSSRMAVMGHSMGGGGALLAANAHSNELSAAIPFTSWQPEGNFTNITVPTLVIAGAADSIAPVDVHAWPHYQSIAAGTPKAFLEVSEGDHFVANSSAADLHAIMGRYGIAWLKLHMDGDERYRRFFTASRQSSDSAVLSRYEFNE